jgi:hypothetical protein
MSLTVKDNWAILPSHTYFSPNFVALIVLQLFKSEKLQEEEEEEEIKAFL